MYNKLINLNTGKIRPTNFVTVLSLGNVQGSSQYNIAKGAKKVR